MSKLEVIKTIEARKLNRRSRLALAEPPVTIPYGAILDEVVENGDYIEFTYLRDLYQCKAEILRPASHPLLPEAGAAPPTAVAGTTTGAAPAAAPAAFVWQPVRTTSIPTSRAKVPGGWLIAVGQSGVTFYPDPEHSWDGSTLA